MPRKPKSPCSYPGCPKLTDYRYCEKHKRLTNKNYNKYQRDPKSNKRYEIVPTAVEIEVAVPSPDMA
jgi:5-methylcytosine-specific restriction protein A